jgi:hypothetical protein
VRAAEVVRPFFVDQSFGNSSGSLAMLAAIRRASSLVKSLAADRRQGSHRSAYGRMVEFRVDFSA